MDQDQSAQVKAPDGNPDTSPVPVRSGARDEEDQIGEKRESPPQGEGDAAEEGPGSNYPSPVGLALLAVGLCLAVFLVALVCCLLEM